MPLNHTAHSDMLPSTPFILMVSSASAFLALGFCSILVCHLCMIIYLVHTQLQARLAATHQPSAELCYACSDTEPDAVLLPCGHRGLCSACAARLWTIDRRCPLCRRELCGVVMIGV
jgi:hypothetical protein